MLQYPPLTNIQMGISTPSAMTDRLLEGSVEIPTTLPDAIKTELKGRITHLLDCMLNGDTPSPSTNFPVGRYLKIDPTLNDDPEIAGRISQWNSSYPITP